MLENIIKEIEEITNGERFIGSDQLESIESLNNVYVEDCGLSGTGQGHLYTIYLMTEDCSPDYDNEIAEVVVTD